MLFLIPLALSVISTGYSIYQQSQANYQAEEKAKVELAATRLANVAADWDNQATLIRAERQQALQQSTDEMNRLEALRKQASIRQQIGILISVALIGTAVIIAANRRR